LLSVTLEQSDYESLLQLARGVGMGASTYVRMLIKRAIQELPQQSSQ
jgi:predicted DNA-binding protein